VNLFVGGGRCVLFGWSLFLRYRYWTGAERVMSESEMASSWQWLVAEFHYAAVYNPQLSSSVGDLAVQVVKVLLDADVLRRPADTQDGHVTD